MHGRVSNPAHDGILELGDDTKLARTQRELLGSWDPPPLVFN
jgi:hypothetical protein